MAKLIVVPQSIAKLKSSDYHGEPTGTIEINENGEYNVKAYATADVNVPQPSGNITLTTQGQHNVTDYETATVALPMQSKSVTPSTSQQTVQPDTGYEGLSSVAVAAAPLESKTVTPTTSQQTFTPQSPAIGFSQVTVEGYTPQQEADIKYVNFIDYDGSILYSYTKAEIQSLTELPELPFRTGYTYQGWNWTLENIKSYDMPVFVGALRKPNDCNACFDFIFYDTDSRSLTVNFTLQKSSYAVVSWGDGTEDTYTNESTSSALAVSANHTYSIYGNLSVKITYTGTGHIEFKEGTISDPNGARLYGAYFGDNVSLKNKFLYASAVQYISVGTGTDVDDTRVFNRLRKIKALVLPRTLTDIKTEYCSTNISLTYISMPDTLTAYINGSAFLDCYGLQSLAIPKGVTQIKAKAFENVFQNLYLYLPSSITSYLSRAFYGNTLYTIDLSDYSDPQNIPSIESTSCFGSIGQLSKIYVRNQDMLQAFSGATNWSTYANLMQIGGYHAD